MEEFLQKFHHSLMLGAHQNILKVFPDTGFSLESQCCMFASEYAPLATVGDLYGQPHFFTYFSKFCVFIINQTYS